MINQNDFENPIFKLSKVSVADVIELNDAAKYQSSHSIQSANLSLNIIVNSLVDKTKEALYET